MTQKLGDSSEHAQSNECSLYPLQVVGGFENTEQANRNLLINGKCTNPFKGLSVNGKLHFACFAQRIQLQQFCSDMR